MFSFSQLVGLLQGEAGLADKIDISTVTAFIRLATMLKPDILHSQLPSFDPKDMPHDLPDNIATYLAAQLALNVQDIQALWRVFGVEVWIRGAEVLQEGQWFRELETSDPRFAPCMLYPPVQRCNNIYCDRWQLLRRRKEPPMKVTLFTLDRGVCDALAANLYCYGCDTNYYPNYYVRARSQVRTYYSGIPDAIQVAEHKYIDRRVLELFKSLTLFAWTSATNAAHVYHHSLSQLCESRRSLPQYQLRTEHVWDGFVILSLLMNSMARKSVLEVPHSGEQKDRFTAAMRARNKHIHDFGQPEFLHFCTKCVRRLDRDDGSAGYIDVLVTDGIEMGRPCCTVRHCTEELLSTQDRYCPSHAYLAAECVIDGCIAPAPPGYKTCSDPVHREVERWNGLHGKAMFTLRRALLRSNVSNPDDAVEPSRGPEEHLDVVVQEGLDGTGHPGVELYATPAVDDTCTEQDPPAGPSSATSSSTEKGASSSSPAPTPASVPCPDKPAATSRSMRAMFGRRRTHNEQIFIRPCGVIVKRATFYGSETTPQVLSLFRETFKFPGYAPSYLIYDNGCGLYKHSQASGETLHMEIGLPVDVFHWKCKHKKSDDACAIHCNPYSYPELRIDDDGNWFFNTSIAEQNNVWLGGYRAIIREMTAVKYDFFLDQVIMEKNELTKGRLEARGCIPDYRPRA